MAPRRRRRRPWYRTRAYRLTRTALLTVVLVTVGVRCTGDDRSTAPYGPDGPYSVAAAGPDAEGAAGTDTDVTGGTGAEGTRGPDADVAGGPGAEGSRGPGADVAGGPDADVSRGPGSEGTRGPAAPSARLAPTRTPSLRPLPRSRPTSFRIPSLGIDAPVTGLGLIKGRELATPPADKPKLVGWYQGGPTPGESGTAIAVGHRDTRSGPAVFAALAQVKPGKVIEAGRADGRTAVYTVDRVKVFDKEGFPDKEVYGPARRPELRVITCGGLFKWRTGYTSNVVVFAHLTRTREPRPPKSATAR